MTDIDDRPHTLAPQRCRMLPDDLKPWGTLLGMVMIGATIVWVTLLRGLYLADAWFSGNFPIQIITRLMSGATVSIILWLATPYFKGFEAIREICCSPMITVSACV